MGSSIFSQAAEFLRENKTAKRALGIMVCLALLVALGTVGVLTSTGQAMTKKVVVLDCAYRVHAHTADCYDEAGNLTCGQADYVVHVHNEDCYDESGALVCPLPERAPHTHTDACWKEVSELTCGQEEDPGHTHGESCYQYELGELTCVKPEHTHSDECYTTVEVLSCDKPEHTHSDECLDPETGDVVCGLEEHSHDGSCYTQEQQLACGLEEHTHNNDCYQLNATLICTQEERPAGHIHTDACYTTEKVLSCGELELHTHDDSCYDESGALICGQLELLEHVHSGDCLKTVEVQVADESGAICGLVEHTHTDECFDPETGEAICGYVEHTHTESCFPAEETPEPVYVCGLAEHTHSDECYDESGALICTLEEHTHTDACLAPAESEAAPETFCGLVEHTHDESCYNEAGELICGLEEHTHTEDCFVQPVTYYCGLEEHTHSAECYDETGALICGLEEHAHTDACLQQILIQTAKTEDGSILVTAAYGPEANLPQGAVLQVKRIQPDGKDAEHYAERVGDLGDINRDLDGEALIPVALLNVGFFTQDGLEVQPNAPVTVTVQFLDESGAEVGEPLTIVHFAETGVEMMETTPVDGELSASFETNSFSDLWITTSTPEGENGIMLLSGNAEVYKDFVHNKRIDYLGDNNVSGGNTDNKDTDADDGSGVKDDLYRLYLDMEGESNPMNVLFIIDRSDSMAGAGTDGVRRDVALSNVLMSKNGNKGLIEQFLERNNGKPDSEKCYVAGVWFGGDGNSSGNGYYEPYYFDARGQHKTPKGGIDPADPRLVGATEVKNSGDSGTVFNWTKTYNNNLLKCTTGLKARYGRGTGEIGALAHLEGTNYCAGLMAASKMLTNVPNNYPTIVIFLSDGLPTYFYQATDFVKGGTNKTLWRYGEAWEDKSIVCAEGFRSPGGGVVHTEYGFAAQTREFYNAFMRAHPNVKFFTVGIGTGGTVKLRTNYPGKYATWTTDYLTADERKNAAAYPRSYSVLQAMGGGQMLTGNDQASLQKALKEVVFPANVTISDDLSDKVDLYKSNPDILVTATPKNGGKALTLWTGAATFSVDAENKVNGSPSVQKDLDTKAVVSSVTYDGNIIAVHFREDYCLSDKYTYTLSFNVQLTEAAYDAFASGSYPNNGEEGTDYTDNGNSTSSGQAGLFSNDKATVTYKVDEKTDELTYNNPVVQAWGTTFGFTKKSTFDESALEGMYFRLVRDGSEQIAPFGKDSTGKDYVSENINVNGTQETYFKTNANGQMNFGKLKHGNYVLYEYVPEGYQGGGTSGQKVQVLSFTVKKGHIVEVKKTDEVKWTAEKVDLSKFNSEPDTVYAASAEYVTIHNTPIMETVSFYKADENDTTQKLAGAEFQLFWGKEEGDKWVIDDTRQISLSTNEKGSMTSNENGLIFTKEIPYGHFFLKEVKAPTYYDLLEEPVHFWIDADGVHTDTNGPAVTGSDGTNLTVTIKDHRSAVEAKLIKTDATSGQPLGGAEFTLYGPFDLTVQDPPENYANSKLWVGASDLNADSTGAVRGTGKYNKDFPLLKEGSVYFLQETVTPAGHDTLGMIRLVVNGSDLTATLVGETANNFAKLDSAANTYTITLPNSSGFVLPRSGGEGVTVYILSGAALVTLAGSLLLLKRKKEREA